MADTGSNSVVVTTPLPIGADITSGSRNAGSALKTIKSLRPILRLVGIYFDSDGECHYEIGPDLKWDVVLAHTAEVGEITINNREEAIPPGAYMHIPRPGTCLFPNLTRLQLVNDPLRSSLSHLPLFVSPRLHSLEIDNISSDDIPGLDYFLRNQASLKHVTLGPIEYNPRILKAISQCRSVDTVALTFLSSTSLDDEAIELLATTPELQSLTLKADHVPYTRRKIVKAGFVALREICIVGVYSFIESILTVVYATIHTLNVTISSDWAAESPNPFCPRSVHVWTTPTLPPKIGTVLGLVAQKWWSSLNDYTLVVDLGTQETTLSHPTIPRGCTSHLTKLSGLHRLVMSGFNLEGLDDLLQVEIAKPSGVRWPNIEEIQFPIPLGQQMGVRTTISLSTFCGLVQNCKNLVSFSGLITLPPTMDDLFEIFNRNPIQSHLKQLSTGSLEPIEGNHNMIQIARFLGKLCPDLDKLTTHAEFSPTTWSNISGIITVLKEARQEERAALRSLGAGQA